MIKIELQDYRFRDLLEEALASELTVFLQENKEIRRDLVYQTVRYLKSFEGQEFLAKALINALVAELVKTDEWRMLRDRLLRALL